MSLFFGLLMIAEMCGATCTSTAWELEIRGIPVQGLGDMTQQECAIALFELDDQIPAFTPAECVEVGIKREEM